MDLLKTTRTRGSWTRYNSTRYGYYSKDSNSCSSGGHQRSGSSYASRGYGSKSCRKGRVKTCAFRSSAPQRHYSYCDGYGSWATTGTFFVV